jgi:hypothetical protein
VEISELIQEQERSARDQKRTPYAFALVVAAQEVFQAKEDYERRPEIAEYLASGNYVLLVEQKNNTNRNDHQSAD